MAVHLNRSPHSAFLVVWGRATDSWWGCITWQQRVTADGVDSEIGFAAWVPAADVSLPSWSSPSEVPRIALPDDRKAWPAPPGWPSWYAGVWTEGRPIAPAGLELISGSTWRRRGDHDKSTR